MELRLDRLWPGPPRARGIGTEDVVVRDEAVEPHGLDVANEPRDDRGISPDLGLREDRVEAHVP